MVGTASLAQRYRVERQIGTGGMGAIFEAQDVRLDRKVAIKVLRDDLSNDDEFAERFRREARSAAALNHPNIASVYDFGEDEGRDFIVMELLEGADLAARLEKHGKIPYTQAAETGADVAQALAFAHSRGVVHRDIKPANIFITSDGRTKVTDFGIARAEGDATLTMAGSLMGTARYISPEQAAGEPAGAPSDVYALGVVLYEIVTGEAPFDGDSPVAVAARRLSQDVPRLKTVDASVPTWFDEVVARATARDPGARPTALELATALSARTSTTTEPIAPRAATTQVLHRPVRSPRWRMAARTAAALVALIIGLLAFRLLEDDPAESERGGQRSRGNPAPATLVVPNVVGGSLEDGLAAVAEIDPDPTVVSTDDAGVPEGTVVGIAPEAGSEVEAGTPLTLVVGTGEGGDDEDKKDEPEDDERPGKGHRKAKGKEKKD